MALADFQRAFATLATDEVARASFRRSPREFADAFGLDDVEFARLCAPGATRLRAYAESLEGKRANEAARLLPLAARALGADFRAAFLRHARRTRLGEGPERYREDASAFARTPGTHPLVAFEAAARAESARRFPLRLRVARYRCDLRAALDSDAATERGRTARGSTLVLWLPLRRSPIFI